MSHEVTFPTAWRLPASLPDDLVAFDKAVAQFKGGAISATQFQVFRVPQGVYEQRESGAFMIRVRFPAGVALPHQLRTLAQVAEQYGSPLLHVTTRQDIQIHEVPVESIHPVLVLLSKAGLTSKGGGGNTVRNITSCPLAGVCGEEAFDVTPRVLALTEFLLGDLHSFQLPRKYKIAFSGCSQDCAGATINDVGFIAKCREGIQGFSVYVGGGMGSHSRVADLLEDFVLASDVPLVAEAIKRVFFTHGNRKDKRLARLRHLLRQLGFEEFRRLYQEQLASLRREPLAPPSDGVSPDPQPNPIHPDLGPIPIGSTSYSQWLAANVRTQKQAGFYLVEIPLSLGDIHSDTLGKLAAVVERYGEGRIRTTQKQNLLLRWVRSGELAELHQALTAIGLADSQPPLLRDLTTCTGAATCKLGICLSRGVAGAIADHLPRAVNLSSLGLLQISVSGCPNACGRHPVADVGLYGTARRVQGNLVPYYIVQLGGHVEEGGTRLATGYHPIPACSVPSFLANLLHDFSQSNERADFRAFLRVAGKAYLERLAARYRSVPTVAEDKNFYIDWGASEPFSLAGRGPGECGAGIFDLIEVDLKSAEEVFQEGQYYPATVLAARALLVTRGEQANSDQEVFELFQRYFLVAGLVDARFQPLITLATRAAGSPNPAAVFHAPATEVAAFLQAIQSLYHRLDASLQFPQPSLTASTAPQAALLAASPGPHADLKKDFRGVVCPLNYVKTNLALGQIKPGQILAVLLDSKGVQNVPASATKDGHEIVAVIPEGNDSLVFIRKKA
jgi:sulfite reductase (ferredoxin)